MELYLQSKVLKEVDGMVYVERYFNNSVRKGLVVALDLEHYDYSNNSHSIIRATEGTIVDRLPPRIKIRRDALMEIPHILVLIDDPDMSVIEPIIKSPEGLELLYDFDLMQNSGHIKGFHITSPSLEKLIMQSFEKLIAPELQSVKYGVSIDTPPLLFAVGDGNHSLATAKAIWEKNNQSLSEGHPSRYALVEIVNLHDESIKFEPIHRLLKGVEGDWLLAFQTYFADNLKINKMSDLPSLKKEIYNYSSSKQVFGVFDKDGFWLMELEHPIYTLTAGSIQKCLDDLIANDLIKEIDYIHGDQTILDLGSAPGNAAIFLSAIRKDSFFQSVIKDGALPRKTFSMGEAHQKRFYLECRGIK